MKEKLLFNGKLTRVLVFRFVVRLCNAADIQVFLLSARNGHPISERQVQLFVIDTTVKHVPENQVFNAWEYTDANGIALFHVPVLRATDRVFVFGLADYCSPSRYDAEEVLLRGVAQQIKGACPHRPLKKLVLSPHPGEIVIISGEYSGWERRLYFPWPG